MAPLLDLAFDKMNIKHAELSYVFNRSILNHLCLKIEESQSIRAVNFKRNTDVHSQLNTIQTCLHIKKWNLSISHESINEKVIQRLQDLLSGRNDNSLFVSSPI